MEVAYSVGWAMSRDWEKMILEGLAPTQPLFYREMEPAPKDPSISEPYWGDG